MCDGLHVRIGHFLSDAAHHLLGVGLPLTVAIGFELKDRVFGLLTA